ncbi:MGMT family protein [bacterium]|nr:MGMT family protein [bacterium]
MTEKFKALSMYQRIYEVVRRIPKGKVMTYGQVAKIAKRCSPRNVGYAMAAIPFDSDVPWQRVINAKGEISTRTGGDGELVQKQILLMEGVEFNKNDRINLKEFGWFDGFTEYDLKEKGY